MQVADVVIFVVSARSFATASGTTPDPAALADARGAEILRLLDAQGLPTPLVVLQHIGEIVPPRRQAFVKKAALDFATGRVFEDCKMLFADVRSE